MTSDALHPHWFVSFLRFSRPHTLIGTSLSVLSLFAIALAAGDARFELSTLLIAWISCLGANIYIVGLNQLTDVEIDRINKPYLPLASGAYGMQTGKTIVGVCLAVAIVTAILGGFYLMLTVGLSLVLGTIYSLPPIRLKRFHFWAAFCILAVRGLIVNVFLYLHFDQQLSLSTTFTPLVAWLMGVMFVFSIVIAWFKDIPDMAGDADHDIRTLSLRLGAQKVYRIGVILLAITYGLLVLAGLMGVRGGNGTLLAIGHILLLGIFLMISARVDPTDEVDMPRYYQFVWGLFFLEYILFATVAWL